MKGSQGSSLLSLIVSYADQDPLQSSTSSSLSRRRDSAIGKRSKPKAQVGIREHALYSSFRKERSSLSKEHYSSGDTVFSGPISEKSTIREVLFLL